MEKNKRINYIDIAKAVLITCVVLGHMPYAVGLLHDDYPYVCFPINETMFLYVGIYMQAFFFLSGYTSHFDKKFLPFIVSNVKCLLVPCFVLGSLAQIINYLLIGDYSVPIFPKGYIYFLLCDDLWFLWAMFGSRVIYWTVCHLITSKLSQGIVMALILVAGTYLNNTCDNSPSYLCNNYCFYRTAMCLGIFLWLGDMLKTIEISEKVSWAIGLLYIPLIITSRYLPSIQPVGFAGSGGGMDYWQIPQSIIFVITGTFLLVCVCRRIGDCAIMQHAGQNSLVVYGTNMPIILFAAKIIDSAHIPTGKLESIVYLLTLLIVYSAIQSFIIYLINKSPLTYVCGKWK